MRITNSMMIKKFIENLNRNAVRMDKYHRQASSGIKLSRLSDDPAAMIKALEVKCKLSKLQQYNDNIRDAKDWLSNAESALNNVNEIIKSAYELTIDIFSSTRSIEEKKNAADYVDQLKQKLLDHVNISVRDKYIFSGFNTKTAPVKENGGIIEYHGLDIGNLTAEQLNEIKCQKIMYETGQGQYTEVNYMAVDILGHGQDNIMAILDRLAQVLRDESEPSGSEFPDKLLQRQSLVLGILTDIGGKIQCLELLENRYAHDEINYMEYKTNIEGADIAEALMQLKMAEMVYNSALSTGARIMQLSLVDFLR